jgi:hypothetical protein
MTYRFSINDVMDIAAKKSGVKGWIAYSWERCGPDSIVTGGVPVGAYKSGPRKGEPRFRGPGNKIVVSRAEMEATAAAYESETGNCWNCYGTGQLPVGWNKADGMSHGTCTRCGGSGIAPEVQP